MRLASLVVPAKGDYTTQITWGDKTPASPLYGVDLGDTILGSGIPAMLGSRRREHRGARQGQGRKLGQDRGLECHHAG